jgi:hypothetical protein
MGKKPGQKAAESAKKTEAAAKKKPEAKAAEHAEHAEKAEKKAAKKHPHKEVHHESREKMHCKIAKCKRRYRAKGYCVSHYREWRHGKFGRARYKICRDIGCLKPQGLNRHGYCEDHFQNYYVKGLEVAKAPAPEKPAAKPAEAAKEAASA